MKKIECHIVQDLLPLYMDHVCSKPTEADVEAHLESCERCQALCEKMRMDMKAAVKTPDLDGKKMFRQAEKNILVIIAALAVVISCFVTNAGGGLAGGRANGIHLTATIFYGVFWILFLVCSRNYMPLVKFSFVIGCISFVSAAIGLLATLFSFGGFFTGILVAILVGAPFYGLRAFMDWTELYAVAAGCSLVWVIFTWRCKSRLENRLSDTLQGKTD